MLLLSDMTPNDLEPRYI